MSQQPNFNDIIILDRYVTYGDRRIIFGNKTWEDFDREDYPREFNNINFNPNDGIETTLVLKSKQDTDNFEESTYLVVGDKTANKVYSRWFIMDATRLSKGMFSFKLRRDVVAEFISEDIGNTDYSPFYVEKGILPESSPLIVNSEGLSLNQIKVDEQKIYDEQDQFGWIVGYVAANHGSHNISVQINQGTLTTTTFTFMAAATGIDEADLIGMMTAPLNFTNGTVRFEGGFKLVGQEYPPYLFALEYDENLKEVLPGEHYSTWKYDHCIGELQSGDEENFLSDFATNLYSNTNAFKNAIQSAISLQNPGEKFYLKENLEKLRNYEGRYITYNGIVYRIHITGGAVSQHAQVDIHDNDVAYFNTALGNAFATARTRTGNDEVAEYLDWEMYLMPYSQIAASIQLEEVEAVGTTTYSFTLPTSVNQLNDAPYVMFAMPLTRCHVETLIGGNNVFSWTPDREISLRIAAKIATELDAELYDIQVLPYCPPLPGVAWNNDLLENEEGTEGVDYSFIKKTGDTGTAYSGLIFYCKTSNFSRTLRYISPVLTMKQKNMKIESQTDFYRLCSPNYNGVFEFNLAKNGGSVNYWNIDCTYKPFNPFIRVSPEFKFLYGQNYQDGRGLICGGDFSLPIVKDRWIEYEMNNKNFASIFSREIQNLEFTQEQERLREKILAVAGTVGGTTGGAVAGGKAGGAYGAIAGGLMGAGAGVVGGALDIALGEARRGETRQYAIDRFNLGLGNIKALPQSLTRTSTLNVINKIHPFVERYTCTDEEVKALENKITYDGMTVGKIATLNGFTSTYGGRNYFKGQLIKTFEIGYDAHFFDVLNEEFMKGVYI